MYLPLNTPSNILRSTRPWALISLVAVLMCTSDSLFSQDPVFSQFYLSPLQLNPGLAGLTEDPRFSANYRNQFPGFNNAYRTYALSYDQFFESINSGIGIWLLSDDAGDGILKTLKAGGIFSYQLELTDRFRIRSGIEVGYVQSTLNWDRLVFGDQIDDYTGTISPGGIPFPTEETAPEKNKVVYADVGIGSVIYSETFYAGLSLRHLNRPDPDFLSANPGVSPRIPIRMTSHAGAAFPISGGLGRNMDLALSPAVILVRQGNFFQVNGGLSMDAEAFTLGLHYRMASGNSEAIIASIGLRTNNLRIGYSFDYNISGFPLSGGTHEVGITYSLDDGDRESRYNDCFAIFR